MGELSTPGIYDSTVELWLIDLLKARYFTLTAYYLWQLYYNNNF